MSTRQRAADRRRRALAAGTVLLVHVLVLGLALMVRTSDDAPPVDPALVTMMLDLTQEVSRGELPAQPRSLEPQLQELAPRIEDVVVEPQPIELTEMPTVVDVPPTPPSAPVTATAEAGLAGDATAPSGNAGPAGGLVLVRRVLPQYPAEAGRRGEQGVTAVLLHVAESGRVMAVKVERSSGSKDLDRAAVDAFRRWQFQRMPSGSAPDGKWVRTSQLFVTYRFLYTRLEAGAEQSVYAERLQPRPGTEEEVTAGSQEALLRFIAEVAAGTRADAGRPSPAGIAGLRAALAEWGSVKSVQFSGIAANSRWKEHAVRQDAAAARRTVTVSWSMFEIRHQNATSQWLIATDHDGEIWSAQAGRVSST
jgi:protein TonB